MPGADSGVPKLGSGRGGSGRRWHTDVSKVSEHVNMRPHLLGHLLRQCQLELSSGQAIPTQSSEFFGFETSYGRGRMTGATILTAAFEARADE